MQVIEEQHVPIADNYPIVAYIFGSSLLANMMTTACVPLQLYISFLLNIMIAIRHLYGQWNLCNTKTSTKLDPVAAFGQLESVMSSLVPFGFSGRFPLAIMPTPLLCFLLFIIVEVFVVSSCFLVSLWMEASSRIQFLKHLAPEDLDEHYGYEELFDLMHADRFGLVIRTLAINVCIITIIYAAMTLKSMSTSDHD